MHEIQGCHERPYDRENTASRLICEVKHVPVWIVVRWGTTREVQMLFFYYFFLSFFILFSLFFIFLPSTKYEQKENSRGSCQSIYFLIRVFEFFKRWPRRRAQRMKIIKLKHKREHLYDSSSFYFFIFFLLLLLSSVNFSRPLTFLFKNNMYVVVAAGGVQLSAYLVVGH